MEKWCIENKWVKSLLKAAEHLILNLLLFPVLESSVWLNLFAGIRHALHILETYINLSLVNGVLNLGYIIPFYHKTLCFEISPTAALSKRHQRSEAYIGLAWPLVKCFAYVNRPQKSIFIMLRHYRKSYWVKTYDENINQIQF